MPGIGKMLILFGFIMIGLGLLFLVGWKIPGFGRLPGDIVVRRGNFTFYFPLMTSVLLSILLTLLFSLFGRK